MIEFDEHAKQLLQQLRAMAEDFENLSKKKPDDKLNKFKVELVNDLLRRANSVLSPGTPIKSFVEFDSEDLPSNSDVLLVLSQYVTYLGSYKPEIDFFKPFGS